MIATAVILVFSFGCLIVGMWIFDPHTKEECAEASLMDNPPVWWQHAVIDAKAKKEKNLTPK